MSKNNGKTGIHFHFSSLIFLVLRIIIGYHFLYEGVNKLFSENWSAEGFLMQANWFLSGLFNWMGESETILSFVNFANVWGQVLIGILLIVGFRIKIAAWFGALMLLTYYIAIPPFTTNLFFLDRNLLELLCLLLIAQQSVKNTIGLDGLLSKVKEANNG